MVSRLKILLEQDELNALLEMARGELRPPDEQVRFILRQELQRRGLLPVTDPVALAKGLADQPAQEAPHAAHPA